MPDFGILAQKYGLAENVPGMLLSEAFVQSGSENIHERYGEYHKIRGRLPQLYDADNEQIACPTNVYVITAINAGTKTLTVTGDVTSVISDGDTVRINAGTTAGNNAKFTVNGTPTYSAPSSTVIVAESLSAAGATPGNLFAGATPVIEYHRHVKEKTGTEYLLLGTAYHILLWGNSDKSLTVKFTCGSACTRWEIVTHIDNVYATNNVDKIQWWNVESSPSNSFAVLDNASGLSIDGGSTYITKAKHIFSMKKYLFVGYVTDSDGDVHPSRIIHSTLDTSGATIDFRYDGGTGDAAQKDFPNTSDFLMGFAKWGDNIIIGKQRSIHKGWLTTQSPAWEWVQEPLNVGVLSGDTFVNSKDGRLFWLASDMTIRELHNPKPISNLIDLSVRSVNVSVAEYAQATFIDQYNSLAFAVPTGSSETNDKLLCIEVDKRTWFIQDIPVRAFGDYTQQEVYTYGTLPYDTYSDWGAAWLIYDTQVNVLGFPLDLVSDYSGYTYDLFRADSDAGSSFTGNIIIGTSYGKANIRRFKRINNGADLYFNREASGSVTLEAKRDNESTWQSLGSASLIDTNLPEIVVVHVPFDIRARHFLYQLSSTSHFEFLGMTFCDYELEGIR